MALYFNFLLHQFYVPSELFTIIDWSSDRLNLNSAKQNTAQRDSSTEDLYQFSYPGPVLRIIFVLTAVPNNECDIEKYTQQLSQNVLKS